jgi:hypothetical protein
MVLNNNFEAPYNKFAPEGAVPIISKALVKSRLSNKFFEVTNNEMTENQNNKMNYDEEQYLQDQVKDNTRIKNQIVVKGTKSNENEHIELEKLKEVVLKLKNEVQVYIIIY